MADLPATQAYLDGELCGVRPDGLTSFSMILSRVETLPFVIWSPLASPKGGAGQAATGARMLPLNRNHRPSRCGPSWLPR